MAQSIALFPLNVVLFPEGPLPLRIFETRYVDMVSRCMREDQRFGVALIREGSEVGPAATFDIGTMAKIVDFHQLSDGFLGLSCVGEQRFRILSRSRQPDGLNLAGVESLAREAKTAVPERHARLAELLKTVLPQLGEGGLERWKENCLPVYAGKGNHDFMLILLILLIVLLIGATPAWPYSRGWGYYPSGVLGTILVIFLVLLLLGQVNL